VRLPCSVSLGFDLIPLLGFFDRRTNRCMSLKRPAIRAGYLRVAVFIFVAGVTVVRNSAGKSTREDDVGFFRTVENHTLAPEAGWGSSGASSTLQPSRRSSATRRQRFFAQYHGIQVKALST
jgi:hypothetical protein